MRIFYNYIHLSLSLSFLAVFINTSWAENKRSEDLLRDALQNNDKFRKNPSARTSRQIDQRLSDVIAENVLHFGHSMGLELAALDPNGMRSEIFSPVSLMAALSLLTLGAKGKSYQELKQLLGLDSDSELISDPNKYHEEFGLMLNDLQHTNVNSGGVNKRPNANWRFTHLKEAPVRSSGRVTSSVDHIIKVANGLFVQNSYTLNPDYRQVVQSIYKSEFKKLDFNTRSAEAVDYINAWVNDASFGKIPKIIADEIDKSTNVILGSVLYFKAFWQTQFFFGGTTEDDFFPDGLNNPPIKVQMMPAGGVYPFYDAKEYDCRIIGLPYRGNETTMYVIQPNNSSRRKLRELQHMLDAHKINGMIDKMERKTTVLLFPKMHFTRSIHLKKILQNMNLHDIFVNWRSDLSLIGQKSQTNAPQSSVPSPMRKFTQRRISTQTSNVSFESIHREKPVYQGPQFNDRYCEPALVFSSRFGEVNVPSNSTENSTVLTPIEVLSTTEQPSNKREKRQLSRNAPDIDSLALSNLESDRQKPAEYKSDLYVNDIIHNVDFSVDEQGTEAAAATLTHLVRSGTDVVFRGETPFLIVIRHDPTKLPLFYGIINKPEL